MEATELAYRKTAADTTSGFGLLIALYDTLAGNLRRAAEAERRNDIEKRCQEINHALLVVAYLEDWIERGTGGKLARQLSDTYVTLRRKMIEAQARRSPEILEQQMGLILDIRGFWQELELRGSATAEAPQWSPTQVYPGASVLPDQRSSSSWSA